MVLRAENGEDVYPDMFAVEVARGYGDGQSVPSRRRSSRSAAVPARGETSPSIISRSPSRTARPPTSSSPAS
ncbi:MAG: hypothetical protein R2849_04210 [Thermomicrobiales bacterium]